MFVFFQTGLWPSHHVILSFPSPEQLCEYLTMLLSDVSHLSLHLDIHPAAAAVPVTTNDKMNRSQRQYEQ